MTSELVNSDTAKKGNNRQPLYSKRAHKKMSGKKTFAQSALRTLRSKQTLLKMRSKRRIR